MRDLGAILRREVPEPEGVELMRPGIFRGLWWSSIGLFASWFCYTWIDSDGFASGDIDPEAFVLLLMAPFYIGWCWWSSWKAWRLNKAGRLSWAFDRESLCWIHESGTVTQVALSDVVALRNRVKPEIDVIGDRGMVTLKIGLYERPLVVPASGGLLFDLLARRLRQIDPAIVISAAPRLSG